MFEIAERTHQIRPFYVMDLLSRAQQLEQSGVSIVHMEVGEPDFSTPPMIIEAGSKALASGQIKYTSAAGNIVLRERIVQHYDDQYGVSLSTDQVFVTPGASGAFTLALAMLINPGDEVLLPDPCYPCNRNFIHLFEGKPRLIPVDGSNNYQFTAEVIQQYWNHKSCGTIIASPSNPTGTLISAAQLQTVIDLISYKKGWVVSDEIYHGLIYGQANQSALQFNKDVLVINSFSKYFGMTGWRLGWLIVPEALVNVAEKLMQNLFISASAIAQSAAMHAFDKNNIEILEQRRQEFQTRRDFLYNALISLGFTIKTKPQGAFYIYAGCERFTDDSDSFARELLEDVGVAITPGRDFGEHQANQHIRFAYTTSIDNLEAGVERIARFISK